MTTAPAPKYTAAVEPILHVVEDEWLTPEPLDNYERPAFPTHVLPAVLAAYVTALAIETGTPHDLAGMLVLSAVAIVCAKYVVVTKPWPEPVNLWAVVAMAPGERKSPVHTKVFSPIGTLERQIIEATATARHSLRADRAATIAFAKQRMADAKKEGDLAAYKKADVDRQEAEAMPNPAEPRLLAGDVTPEAIVKVLAENDGRIGISNDEGGIFETLNGRYSSGTANLDAMLQAHDGGTIRVDRVGRPSQFVDKPALTLGLTVQPEILHQIGSNREFRGRGLLARVLWSVPDTHVGHRPVDVANIPDSVSAAYVMLLQYLNTIPEVMPLHLSDDASEEFKEFRTETEKRLRPSGDLGGAGMAGWANKHAGSLLRIAALLHVVKNGGPEASTTIDLETLTEALEFSPYLIAHARIALDALGMSEDTATARRVLEWIKRQQIATFFQRDACSDLGLKVEQIGPGLDLLVLHGYLHRLKAVVGEKGGRPSVQFEVWPGLLEVVSVDESAA